ncbi:hypothetical protein J416_14682 [Gracilibacillus halophilus YIM-C55.5]|uniref:IDEAL domain-containing protein n=1 Tax=Gracilibacillus halophilus YIM-C55.5 TaxID=1308866 RepID=N4WR65_9BACI|nr:IDEAL domain-containing protein [Gracilibacillus halophilus]ENH95711.1 hypothetical protein J416_14682 [Gracilibacillus halophilus YIM-C55.5]
MKKQKTTYQLKSFYMNQKGHFMAKREISYEIKLVSQLLLDDLCYRWNKARLDEQINQAIDTNDTDTFMELSHMYQSYVE